MDKRHGCIANLVLLFIAEKIEQFAVDVKHYQTDKAERETGSIDNMEAVNSVELAMVTEPEFQYGAEAFEAHQQQAEKVMSKDNASRFRVTCSCVRE